MWQNITSVKIDGLLLLFFPRSAFFWATVNQFNHITWQICCDYLTAKLFDAVIR